MDSNIKARCILDATLDILSIRSPVFPKHLPLYQDIRQRKYTNKSGSKKRNRFNFWGKRPHILINKQHFAVFRQRPKFVWHDLLEAIHHLAEVSNGRNDALMFTI